MTASIQQIQKAAEGWSIEVTPAGATKIDSFATCLSPGTTVNVTFFRAPTRWKLWRLRNGCIMKG